MNDTKSKGGMGMSNLTLQAWEQEFRKAARADGYGNFRDHMLFLAASGRPNAMMRATILVVHAVTVYRKMDGRNPSDFLAMQAYEPTRSPDAPYVLTLDLCGHAYARLLADPQLRQVDLADLYSHPWDPYRVVGFSDIYISHADCSDLTKKEIRKLGKLVTEDLRFDFAEDEIDLWFDDSDPRYLHVHAQDHFEADDDVESSTRNNEGDMEKPTWTWAEGKVDPSSEHFELRYGNAADSDYESWHLLALIGKPEGNAFPVTWLLNPETPEEHEMIKDARGQLDFYLVELGYEDPWAYACYHCGTASNVYSSIHWSYFPHGCGGGRRASALVRDKEKGHPLFIVKPDISVPKPLQERRREGPGRINKRREKHRAFINKPEDWPKHPILPMKHIVPGVKKPDRFGVLVYPEITKIVIGNLHELPDNPTALAMLPNEAYGTVEEMLDAGWRVD
jgi:hypothetical protein